MGYKANITLFIFLLSNGAFANSNDAAQQFDDLRVLVRLIEKLQKTNSSAVLTRKESLESYLRENSDIIIGDDSRSVSEDFIKILPLTTYCGPGNWVTILNGEAPKQKTVAAMDSCCEAHDKCAKTLRKEQDLQKYPGLPWRYSFFTRLHCSCDVEFLNCIDALDSEFLSAAVKWIYTIVQPYCFKEEYRILNCTHNSDMFWFGSRCTEYEVDAKSQRQWQWFDIPFPSSNILNFPKILLKKIYEDLFLDSAEYDFSISV